MEKYNNFNPTYTLPTSTTNATLTELEQLKQEIITHLTNLTSKLPPNVTMETPLLDANGYPRSDFDVLLVRCVRAEIIKARNDLIGVDDLIEKLVQEKFQTLNKKTNDVGASVGVGRTDKETTKLDVENAVKKLQIDDDDSEIDTKGLKPIVSIHAVQKSSPAAQAGFKENDLILSLTSKADALNVTNFKGDLKKLKKLILETVESDDGVEVIVQRNEGDAEGKKVVKLVLNPKKWDGAGVVGCRFDVVGPLGAHHLLNVCTPGNKIFN
ncbi:unnamed protein product [Ambrosiozyma monospora]|uniref:Unnamed protein product n=1 Tax=Ambrosiozyma monospora TaxID=43982 RepID=A0ACB5SXM6_AMBMO|nr:unnamed protein product [Ambrosiozyma monospora]